MTPPDLRIKCAECGRHPSPAVEFALTRELLARAPAPGTTLEAHGWTIRLGTAAAGATICGCPEHPVAGPP